MPEPLTLRPHVLLPIPSRISVSVSSSARPSRGCRSPIFIGQALPELLFGPGHRNLSLRGNVAYASCDRVSQSRDRGNIECRQLPISYPVRPPWSGLSSRDRGSGSRDRRCPYPPFNMAPPNRFLKASLSHYLFIRGAHHASDDHRVILCIFSHLLPLVGVALTLH